MLSSEIRDDGSVSRQAWRLAAPGGEGTAEGAGEGDAPRMQQEGELPPVLVVDDKQENRYSFRKLLEQAEYRVVEAASGMEALQYLLRHEVSLILVDVQMPGMDGFETVQAIREKPRHRDVPILFVTAVHRSEDFAHYGFSVGAHDYLTKPVDSRHLLNKVRLFHTLYRQQKLLEQANAALKASQEAQRKAEAREQYAAYRSGVAEMSTRVLHHIGNSITGMRGAIGEIKQMTGSLGELQALFQQVTERLSEAERSGNRDSAESISRTLLETSLKLPELLRKEMLEPLERPVQNLELGILHIIDAIQAQRREGLESPHNYVQFSLRELMEDLRLLLSEPIERLGVKVEEVYAVAEECVALPKNQLLEALSALLHNSLDAVEQRIVEGGLVQGEGVVQIRCQQLEGQLRIELQDNGCGFPQQQSEMLFRFGYSSREGRAGTGLHRASNFVASCRGDLRIESEGVGSGTTVTLWFPLRPVQAH